jgi:hypothetical protein
MNGPTNEPEDATMTRRACWALCLMTLLGGCGQKAPQPAVPAGPMMGRAETTFRGMKLTAEGNSPGAGEVCGESAILTVAGKRIDVQKEQILVDGVTKTEIPPGTKTIRAISRKDEVVVEVDGKEAFTLGP